MPVMARRSFLARPAWRDSFLAIVLLGMAFTMTSPPMPGGVRVAGYALFVAGGLILVAAVVYGLLSIIGGK